MTDFIENLLLEIHEENIKKRDEAEELMERLTEEAEDRGWIKLFERLK